MSDPSTDPDVPALQTRLTREYGLRHPFVGAGMGFIAHEQLAAAVTNAGGLGVLGASPDPAASLIAMVERLRALIAGRSEWTSSAPILHSGLPAQTSTSMRASNRTYRWRFHHDPPPTRWVARNMRGIRVWMQASSPPECPAAIGLGVGGASRLRAARPAAALRGRIPLHVLLRTIRHKWPTCWCWGLAAYPTGPSQPLHCVPAPTESGSAPLWSLPWKPTPIPSTGVDSSIHPVGHCAALHSDLSGQTSHTGFWPPPQ